MRGQPDARPAPVLALQCDAVTQSLFSMGLLAHSIELLLERDPSRAAATLATLRDLQRDALATVRAMSTDHRITHSTTGAPS